MWVYYPEVGGRVWRGEPVINPEPTDPDFIKYIGEHFPPGTEAPIRTVGLPETGLPTDPIEKQKWLDLIGGTVGGLITSPFPMVSYPEPGLGEVSPGDGGATVAVTKTREEIIAEVMKDVKIAGFELPSWLIPLLTAGIGLIAGGGLGSVIGGVGGVATTVVGGGGGGGISQLDGIPLVGPGVPEPPAAYVTKRWETRVYDNELGYIKLNFYALTNGKIAMYHNSRKYWKVWKPKKHIVISSDPRMSQIRKLERTYDKVIRTLAKKSRALKLAK